MDLDTDVDPAAGWWVGWYAFELADGSKPRLGIEVNVLRDGVSFWLRHTADFWLNGISLAVIDRPLFRAWLRDPQAPLVRHDLVWRRERNRICLTVDVGLARRTGISAAAMSGRRRHSESRSHLEELSALGTLLPMGIPVAPLEGIYSYAVPRPAIRLLAEVI